MNNYMSACKARLSEVLGRPLLALESFAMLGLNSRTIDETIDTLTKNLGNESKEKMWDYLREVLVIGYLKQYLKCLQYLKIKSDINIELVIQNLVNSNQENHFFKNTRDFDQKVAKAIGILVNYVRIINWEC